MYVPYLDRYRRLVAISLLLVCATVGCASTSNKWVALRSTPRNPLSDTLGLVTRKGPKPTERTIQLLRRYDLESALKGDRSKLLARLEEIDRKEPRRGHVYALAELAYVEAKRAERALKYEKALELHGAAVLHSYRFLFDELYAEPTNFYDPEFRLACDLYNGALESTLRILQERNELLPGNVIQVKTANHQCQLKVDLNSKGWHADDFAHFRFVSDYEVHGLTNHYHSYGLGVPLIAVRKHHENMDPEEEFYPEELSFPVTAFLRIVKTESEDSPITQAVLELHDPLDHNSIELASAKVPLETDLSTPLAHTLSNPDFDDTKLSTAGLLMPEKAADLRGLYMLEPFQPEKIPVLMVHGLWSSPVTWMEMFNDLRSDPAIRKNYQFWFYLYPSGQPFWFSAANMREDLAHMRAKLDPQHQHAALDQTVLVGHSMGGLVSKLQTIDSGNAFWDILSENPFSELQAEDDVRTGMARTFFFHPSPSVRRVVTIGTPHRGSEFANDATRWLGRKLIGIPSQIMQGRNQLIARNPGFFRPNAPLDVSTSIDSLDPDSPLLPVLLAAQQAPWVKYHNIVGEKPKNVFTNLLSGGAGDGVVTLDSAKLDDVQSQIVVAADHSQVHRHPQSVLEVRRILLQHVSELRTFPYGDGVIQVASPPLAAPDTTPLGPTVAPVETAMQQGTTVLQ